MNISTLFASLMKSGFGSAKSSTLRQAQGPSLLLRSPCTDFRLSTLDLRFHPLFLYVQAANKFRASANTPRATKLRQSSIRVVPFRYTERRISTK